MKQKVDNQIDYYLKTSLMIYKPSNSLSLDFNLVVDSLDRNEDFAQSLGSNDIVHEFYRKSTTQRDKI